MINPLSVKNVEYIFHMTVTPLLAAVALRTSENN